ncbi:unnamed protein product [Prunus brigantina]
MASKKIQTVPVAKGKSVSASFSSGDSAGVVTRSKAKAISATPQVTSIPTQAKAKDVNRRHEPVMVTGAMSIEEQLAHMSEAVMKLTKMVEEKDAQIASLINKWEAHQDKEPGQDANKKAPHHEAESSEKGLGHETSRVRSRMKKLTPPRWVLCRSNNFGT